MVQAEAQDFAPALNLEEKLKKYLLPPQLYIRMRYNKEKKRVKEIGLLPFLCHPGKASLDVGANKGIYAYAMLKHSAAVHAFEPHPKMFDMMASYLGRSVTAYQIALSNEAGTAKMYLPKTEGGYSNLGGSLNERDKSRHVAVDVEAKRLDDIAIDNIGFIKIDVEGFEMQVLEGAKQTLAKWRPNLLVEVEDVHNTDPQKGRVETICKTYGYRCYALRRGQLTPFHALDPAESFNRKDRKNYIFNFIFLPE